MKAKAGMKNAKYMLFPDSTHTSRSLLFVSIVIPSAGASGPPPASPHIQDCRASSFHAPAYVGPYTFSRMFVPRLRRMVAYLARSVT